jgi:F0F1-type ATP synthase alpha subunit
LEAFAKFGSDLDAVTLNVIEKGKRNVEILKQAQNDPLYSRRSNCDYLCRIKKLIA